MTGGTDRYKIIEVIIVQLIQILREVDKARKQLALDYVNKLWEVAPPGTGGFVDPCDYCINRNQDNDVCIIRDNKEECVRAIKKILKPFPFNNVRYDKKGRCNYKWI